MVPIIVTCKVEVSALILLARNMNTSILQDLEIHTENGFSSLCNNHFLFR